MVDEEATSTSAAAWTLSFPAYTSFNQLIGQTVCSFTASLHFDSILNVDIKSSDESGTDFDI